MCVCFFFFLTPLLKYSFAYTQISTGRDKGEEKQKERKARARLTKETSFIFFFYCYYSKSDDYNRRIEEDYLSVFFFPPFFSLEPLRWQKPLFFFPFFCSPLNAAVIVCLNSVATALSDERARERETTTTKRKKRQRMKGLTHRRNKQRDKKQKKKQQHNKTK